MTDKDPYFLFPRDTWFGACERLSYHTRQVFWPIIEPWEHMAVWILDFLTAVVLTRDAYMRRLAGEE